jgi:hypothetical protein
VGQNGVPQSQSRKAKHTMDHLHTQRNLETKYLLPSEMQYRSSKFF